MSKFSELYSLMIIRPKQFVQIMETSQGSNSTRDHNLQENHICKATQFPFPAAFIPVCQYFLQVAITLDLPCYNFEYIVLYLGMYMHKSLHFHVFKEKNRSLYF